MIKKLARDLLPIVLLFSLAFGGLLFAKHYAEEKFGLRWKTFRLRFPEFQIRDLRASTPWGDFQVGLLSGAFDVEDSLKNWKLSFSELKVKNAVFKLRRSGKSETSSKIEIPIRIKRASLSNIQVFYDKTEILLNKFNLNLGNFTLSDLRIRDNSLFIHVKTAVGTVANSFDSVFFKKLSFESRVSNILTTGLLKDFRLDDKKAEGNFLIRASAASYKILLRGKLAFLFKKNLLNLAALSKLNGKKLADIRLSLDVSNLRYSGRVRNLSLSSLVPQVKGVADVLFRGDKRVVKARYRLRGFESEGVASKSLNGRVWVDIRKLHAVGSLRGTLNGAPIFSNFSYRGKKLLANFRIKNFKLQSYPVLKSAGLEGKADVNGTVFYFKTLKIKARVLSKRLFFKGAELKDVKGHLTFGSNGLYFSAISSSGVVLKELTYKNSQLNVNVLLSNASAASAQTVLENYGVSLPFKLKGKVSSKVIVGVSFKPSTKVSVKAFIDEFDGGISLNEFNVPLKSSGFVEYSEGKLNLSFSGKVKSFQPLKGVSISEFPFSLRIERDTLKANVPKVFVLAEGAQIKGAAQVEANLKTGKLGGTANVSLFYGTSGIKTSALLSSKLSGNITKPLLSFRGKVKVANPVIPISLSLSGKLKPKSMCADISAWGKNLLLSFKMKGYKALFRAKLKRSKFSYKQLNLSFSSANLNYTFNLKEPKKGSGEINIKKTVVSYGKLPPLVSDSAVIEIKSGKLKADKVVFENNFLTADIFSTYDLENQLLNGSAKINVNLRKFPKNILSAPVAILNGILSADVNFTFRKKFHYLAKLRAQDVSLKAPFLLGKLHVNAKASVADSQLESLSLKGSTLPEGMLLISGSGRELTMSFLNLPVGKGGFWKAKLSGNLKFAKKKLTGVINVSDAVVLKLPSSENSEGSKHASFKLPVDVELSINFLQPIEFKSELAEFSVFPILKLRSVDSIPMISGSFIITDGWLSYLGRKFTISYGTGYVANLLTLRGKLNITAYTQTQGYVIYMVLRGNLSSPQLYFFSEPPLEKEQILALITAGVPPEELRTRNPQFPIAQVAYFITAQVLKPVTKGVAKFFHLESFSISPYMTPYGESVVKFTAVKKLTNKLLITGFQTTGEKPESGLGLRYKLGRNIYLETRYNSYYKYEFGSGFHLEVK